CVQTTIELRGWLALSASGHGSESRRFDLPGLRVVGARSQASRVQVGAASGLALLPGSLVNLTAVTRGSAAPGLTTAGWTYTTQQGSYGATFEVRPSQATVRVLTRAEVRDRQMVFTSWLNYEVSRGEFRTLRLRLRNWAGSDIRVEGTII